MGRVTKRRLRPGELLPPGEPRRLKTSDGYVLLSWLVLTNQYVQVLEHRVRNGRVVFAEVVHHADHDRTNNDPANLVEMTRRQHQGQHRDSDPAEIERLYLSGLTMAEVGRIVGRAPGVIHYTLHQRGVPCRRAIRRPRVPA